MNKGILLAILAGILSGFSIFYNKVIVVSGVDPLMLNIIKNGGAALLLTFALIPHKQQFLHLRKKQILYLFAIALIGGSLPFLLFFTGLKTVPALSANLLQKSMFLWIALLAIPLLGERIPKLGIIGYLLLLTAIWGNAPNELKGGSVQGYLMIFAASLLWAVEYILAKKVLSTVHPTVVAWARMAGGVVILFITAMISFRGALPIPDATLIPAIFGSSILLTGYVLLMYHALYRLPATLTSSILIIAPVITLLLSTTILSDQLKQPSIISIIMTCLGIGLLIYVSQKEKLYGSKKQIVS